ncbi:MAG: aminoglycoside phosphotransferase [Hyphomicrobiales bacterium]|nr:aminoglycoside phosphotransferase [Hyphomicrobiales bacterium]MCP4998033.1 aminoglycoside phosphotransferase [Hyphomicrobiales bacterium]
MHAATDLDRIAKCCCRTTCKNTARYESGRAWLKKLPRIIKEVSQQWDLRLDSAYENSNMSYVIPVNCGHGKAALKIQWPHEECRFEADALKAWNGCGAVRLLEHDPDRHAMLLEHCSPGLPLSQESSFDSLSVLIRLLPRLWIPAGRPFKKLSDEAVGWSAELDRNWEQSGRPCERRLIEAALEYLADLSGTQRPQVLIHQDLHGRNVLSAQREPWLVIDPKPLAGEREFGAASIVRSFEFGHSRAGVIGRLQRLSEELALDRERVRGWTVAQTIAWSFDSAFSERHYETVRWLLEG